MRLFLVAALSLFGASQAVLVQTMQQPAPEESANDWASLVGRPVDEAVATIKAERPDLATVVAVSHDSPVTMDFDLSRVRVFHKDGAVVRPPQAG